MTREELLKVAKPILFSTEMVKAILDDRKTATRRVVIPQPCTKHSFFIGRVLDSTDSKNIGSCGWGTNECGGSIQYITPRYKTSDILYIRETFCPIKIKKPTRAIPEDFKETEYIYKADGIRSSDTPIKWKPSIHMPKAAARIFLRVTNVGVERLQEITEEGALKEGVTRTLRSQLGYEETFNYHHAKDTFKILWNSLNKKRGYDWETNPWVWVIEFERVKTSGKSETSLISKRKLQPNITIGFAEKSPRFVAKGRHTVVFEEYKEKEKTK